MSKMGEHYQETAELGSWAEADKYYKENFISVPILYYTDEDTGEKHYDIEEMVNEFENELNKKIQCVVMCSIEEVNEEE